MADPGGRGGEGMHLLPPGTQERVLPDPPYSLAGFGAASRQGMTGEEGQTRDKLPPIPESATDRDSH